MPPEDEIKQAIFPKRPDPKRVESGPKKGRYLLKDANGKERDWQRVTTFCNLLKDQYGLQGWHKRNVAIGLAQKPFLLSKVSSLQDPQGEDKQTLDGILEQAQTLAGSGDAADQGTAMHQWTEESDLGWSVNLQAPYDKDLTAYKQCLAENGVLTSPEHIERVVVLDDLEIAGTLDRIVQINGKNYIADVKTGKSVTGYPHEIAIQLALYAHADALYDWEYNREPMVEVDQNWGLVIHLPVGQATCTLYWFDIAAGWEMVSTIKTVQDWRKKKGIVKPFDAMDEIMNSTQMKVAVDVSQATGALQTLGEVMQSEGLTTVTGEFKAAVDPDWAKPDIKKWELQAAVNTAVEEWEKDNHISPTKQPDATPECADCGAPVVDAGLLEMSMWRHKIPLCVEHYNSHIINA